METFDLILNALSESFSRFGQAIADFLPVVVSALIVLLVGWIIAKIVARIVSRALRTVKFDTLIEKAGFDQMLNRIKPDLKGSTVVGRIFYWVVFLVFFMAAANILGWSALTNGIQAFMAYLPTLGIALLIFFIGVYTANLVRSAVQTAADSIGISGAKTIADIVYYLLFIFIAITALNQAGVNTDIITSNLTLIIGAILLAFALSYGIASRQIVSNMLSSFYSKGKFKEGQRIEIGGLSGTIESIDSVSVTLLTESGRHVLPSRKLIEEDVLILSDGEAEASDANN